MQPKKEGKKMIVVENKLLAVLMVFLFCAILVVFWFGIQMISGHKVAVKKIKRQLYYDYSYDDFRKMIVDEHMKAVAKKDKKKEKKTLDYLLQLDEIYEFLDQELKIKH